MEGKMKSKNTDVICLNLCQDTFDEITVVDSLLSAIQDLCLNLELNSQYYENTENFVLKLSEERNKYISLSSIARQRLKRIELINSQLEDNLT